MITNKITMSVIFYLEIFCFFGSGYFFKSNIFQSIFLFCIGLGIAFALGELIRMREREGMNGS